MSEWISVKDRLPPEDEPGLYSSIDVLVAVLRHDYIPHTEVYCGYFQDGEWWTFMNCNCAKVSDSAIRGIADEVIAWIPLPEPPKEDV